MNTPHFRTDLGPTLDRELLTKITYVRMLNDIRDFAFFVFERT